MKHLNLATLLVLSALAWPSSVFAAVAPAGQEPAGTHESVPPVENANPKSVLCVFSTNGHKVPVPKPPYEIIVDLAPGQNPMTACPTGSKPQYLFYTPASPASDSHPPFPLAAPPPLPAKPAPASSAP